MLDNECLPVSDQQVFVCSDTKGQPRVKGWLIPEPVISAHGPGTQILVSPKAVFQSGSNFMNFFKEIEAHKLRPLSNVLVLTLNKQFTAKRGTL